MVGKLSLNAEELPRQLSKEELYLLLEGVRYGDMEAREKVIIHNKRLVLYRMSTKFGYTSCDKEDLMSAGIIGLMKAVDSYDLSKGIEFTTYAVKCIDNAMMKYLNSYNKYLKDTSIDDAIYYDKQGKEIKLGDTIKDNSDLEEDFEHKELYEVIREIINQLSERDRKIIMMNFGFYDDIVYSQKDIATLLGIPQSSFSRLKNRLVNYLGIRLEEEGVITLPSRKLKR